MEFIEISNNQFKADLLKEKTNLKWFLWHIGNHSKNIYTYSIIMDAEAIGLFCTFETDSCTFVDIIIKKPFQRKGLGRLAVMKINERYKNITSPLVFKVSKHNDSSMQFFEKLYRDNVFISKKAETKHMYYGNAN